MKLVLVLVLMIVSVMAVVGTFLINSVSTFYIDSFYEDMQNVFNQADVMQSLENAAQAGTTDIQTVVDSYEGQLGIANYRTYYLSLINISAPEAAVFPGFGHAAGSLRQAQGQVRHARQLCAQACAAHQRHPSDAGHP